MRIARITHSFPPLLDCRENSAMAVLASLQSMASGATSSVVDWLDAGLVVPTVADIALWTGVWAMVYCLIYLTCRKEGSDWAIQLHAFVHACVSLVRQSQLCVSPKHPPPPPLPLPARAPTRCLLPWHLACNAPCFPPLPFSQIVALLSPGPCLVQGRERLHVSRAWTVGSWGTGVGAGEHADAEPCHDDLLWLLCL